MRHVMVATLLALAACDGGEIRGPGGDGAQVVVGSSEHAIKAQRVAHDTILATRPKASQLMVDQVNLTLVRNAILGTVVRSVETVVPQNLTDGNPTTTCPYLSPRGQDSTLSCRLLVDQALQDALLHSGSLGDTVEQDVEQQNSTELSADGREFVKGWGRESINSGIDVAAVHAIGILRQQRVCDQAPTQSESAFLLGEQQGQALVEASEQALLPTIPKTQCNTDLIAQTILGDATGKADGFMAENPVCAGYQPSQLAEQVDMTQAEENRRSGLAEGLRQAHEALRVRLVSTWECIKCSCFSCSQGQLDAHGYGDVHVQDNLACFLDSDLGGQIPSTAEDLGALLRTRPTIPPDQCSVAPFPMGDPLVVDLDGSGIRLARERVPFDLAATGEPVLMPALEGAAALLALDLDGNGRIDSGAELFSNATGCGQARCLDGIAALAQHDANRDGRIDERDPVFARLVLWRDLDRDGKSSPDEMTSLSAIGIREIGLEAQVGTGFVRSFSATALRALSYRWTDGTAGLVPDVWFRLDFDRLPRDPRTSGIVSTLAGRRF